jgi:hypothetical protein
MQVPDRPGRPGQAGGQEARTAAAVDRFFAIALQTLALACLCVAAVLAVAGFIEFLIDGRWPDQSILRMGYDSRLLEARWFLNAEWALTIRDLLAEVPTTLLAVALAPLSWRLGAVFARR